MEKKADPKNVKECKQREEEIETQRKTTEELFEECEYGAQFYDAAILGIATLVAKKNLSNSESRVRATAARIVDSLGGNRTQCLVDAKAACAEFKILNKERSRIQNLRYKMGNLDSDDEE